MNVQIKVTTDKGIVYTGQAELSATVGKRDSGKATVSVSKAEPLHIEGIDFTLPVRPFIKRYSGSMSGPKRLTLLVARMAEGKREATVSRSEVQKLWNKMTSLMGGRFNAAYETRARDNGWLSSPKPGNYNLRPAWTEILKGQSLGR